jgi:very-short-patch-repair endonuclease
MSDVNVNINDDSEKNTTTGFSRFLQSLSGYYSQFLETDFKSIREPKRKYSEKQGQMRIGFQLSTFSVLQEKIISQLDSDTPTKLKIKHGQYKASLPLTVRKGISSAIKGLQPLRLEEAITHIKAQLISGHKNTSSEQFDDLFERIEGKIHGALVTHVVDNILSIIKPVLEGQSGAAAALQDIETFSDEIASLLIYDQRESLLEATGQLVFSQSHVELDECLLVLCDAQRIRIILSEYFENFVAQDAFVQIREMLASLQLMENNQFYLNVGEVAFKRSRFPLYYIPVEIEFDDDAITLVVSSTVYTNKKLIDYLLGQLNKTHQITATNPIQERIIHKTTEQSHFEVIHQTFFKILAALFVDGDVDLKTAGITQTERYGLKVSNNMSLNIADKSDESIVNDYEQLMLGLDETDPLIVSFSELVETFLNDDPVSVERIVESEWDHTSTAERLVFQSPLPLAEEQRKVLSALKISSTKFVIVEGPPGTGKSHTITAIAFEMILKNQNILILSDKKEALDVVEGKLNDVIGKVRGQDIDYVNPILRLGKNDSNYSNIIKRSSIEKLKLSVKEFKANEKRFDQQYDSLESGLSQKVNDTIEVVENIKMTDVTAFHEKESALLDRYPLLADIPESCDGEIEFIANMLTLVERERKCLSALLGEDGCLGKLEDYLALLPVIRSLEPDYQATLQTFNQLDIDGVTQLPDLLQATYNAKIPIFGYLFAGSKMREIGKNIQAVTGVYWEKPQHHIDTINALIALPDALLRALSAYAIPSSSLIDLATFGVLGALNEDDEQTLRTFLTHEFDDAVANVFPSTFESIFKTQPNTVMLLNEFTTLSSLRNQLKAQFDSIPDYDYLGEKTQFEQMNTVKLVQQIDKRVTDFAVDHKASAKTLQRIIREKSKFPLDKFGTLKEAFPCMIAGLRDFAEYIPLERNLFDLVIIDEASQVSIAQALPAILRAKKVLVLGDRKQFGNVKTANASKKINEGYFAEVMDTFNKEVASDDISQSTRLKNFNISHSVMDFFELTNNFSIQLRKHFRGYPEMISFSSKYVYDEGLQALKIRGKPIEEVLEFVQVPDLERIEVTKNVNEQEADIIFERLLNMLEDTGDLPSVAIITPFRDQVSYLQRRISNMPERDALLKRIKLAIFTFDTCQGEERDIIYYSMVATRQQDALNFIFPKSLDLSEDEVDGNLKFQRLNVGLSRGKEKLVFVHSKPLDEYSNAIHRVLNHYQSVLTQAKKLPDAKDTDAKSPMEAKLLEWLKATSFVNQHTDNLEIIPQFELGSYLKALHPTYQHPAYKVDFLLRLTMPDGKISQCVIEYDGFEYHFDMQQRNSIQADNWHSYLTSQDVERECVLESFGYKMMRINRFNITTDPVTMLDNKLNDMFDEFLSANDEHDFISNMNEKMEALDSGDLRHCSTCGEAKPILDYYDLSLKSGIGRKCSQCKTQSKPFVSGGVKYRIRRRF